MALSPEEKAQLDALTAKANEPEEDDFDIEIWDEKGAGAKVPYRKGRTWLQRFGIDMPEPPADGGQGQGHGKTKPDANGKPETPEGRAQRYFGGSSKAKP